MLGITINVDFLGWDLASTVCWIWLASVAYAGELNLSANYFGDLARNETGKSAGEYIQLKLIDASKAKIIDTGKSVNEVAYELGFTYPQHLTKVFKRHAGLAPQEYRSRMNSVCN